MSCPACGHEIDTTDLFCRRCGEALTADVPRSKPPPRLADRRAWADPGPPPREPPSLLLGHVAPEGGFWLLFGAIFAGVGTTIGGVFTAVGLSQDDLVFAGVGLGALLLFGGIGFASLAAGIRHVQRARRIWRDGDVKEARVVEVVRDRSVRVNGRSPLVVHYEYEVLGQRLRGKGQTWNDGWRQLPEDARVAVVVDRQDAALSVLHLPPDERN